MRIAGRMLIKSQLLRNGKVGQACHHVRKPKQTDNPHGLVNRLLVKTPRVGRALVGHSGQQQANQRKEQFKG